MIGPRRDRDWFDRPSSLFLVAIVSAFLCLLLWAVLR